MKMSAFRALKVISKNFQEELTRASNELVSTNIEESFEDCIAKRLRDLSLYSAKLKFLQAKPLSASDVSELERNEGTVLAGYGETVSNRIIEQTLAKTAAQALAVGTLLAAPDSSLDPETIKRKEKILAALSEFQSQEALVQYWDNLLKAKEKALEEAAVQWDRELCLLEDVSGEETGPQLDPNDPFYQRLNDLVTKLETMRWLAGRLGVPRQRGYDWLSDPQRRLRAVKLAREPHSIDKILNNNC